VTSGFSGVTHHLLVGDSRQEHHLMPVMLGPE
jgi:hypothetical protein